MIQSSIFKELPIIPKNSTSFFSKKRHTKEREQYAKVGTTSFFGTKVLPSTSVYKENVNMFSSSLLGLLDFALQNHIPSKFILSEGTDTYPQYTSLPQKIEKLLNEGKSVDEIVISLPMFDKQDILFFIFEVTNNFQLIQDQLRNPNLFKQLHQTWLQSFDQLLQQDQERFEIINEAYNEIKNFPSQLQTSDIKMIKYQVEFDVLQDYNSEASLMEIAPDLFANSIASQSIPYIKFNQNQPIYKVFAGETFENRPTFKLFEPLFQKFDKPNTIYFILLLGKENEKKVKESYTYGYIDLVTKKLSFKYFTENALPLDVMLQRISSAFQNLNFVNRKERSFSAYFFIYDLNLREDSFLDLMSLPPFKSFLFMDDFQKPISERKKIKFYYDSKLGFSGISKDQKLSKQTEVSTYLTQYKAGVNDSEITRGRYDIVTYPEGVEAYIGSPNMEVQSTFLKVGTPYMIVQISKAKTRFQVYQFANLFIKLINQYAIVKKDLEEEYEALIPELNDPEMIHDLILLTRPEKKVDKEKVGKISLQIIDPEIFSGDYSRDCQYKDQPIVIPPSMKSEWENKKFKYVGEDSKTKVENRTVLEYKGYHFVCPTDTAPFIALKPKKVVDNPEFTHYPCCYTTPAAKEISKREVGTENRTTNDPIKTKKIISELTVGTIPLEIKDFLQVMIDPNEDLYRMGTLQSYQSVLSAILIALDYQPYLKIKTKEEKLEYVKELRKEIGKNANYLLVSSELYDVPLKNRQQLFLDEEEFLDPSLFYRILEEAFQINIFIFSGTRPEANAEPIYNLDISRFSSIPLHSFDPRRKTVLIYKHWGSETDNLYYPQCELIVVTEQTIGLFEPSMGIYLLNAYYTSKSVTQCVPVYRQFDTFTPTNYVDVLSQGFLISLMNTDSPIHAVSQMIDAKGKLRGLEMTSPYGSFIIATPPLPPVDLNLTKKSNGHYALKRISYENLQKVFQEKPTGKSIEKDKVTGIWFPFESLTFGVFVPIVRVNTNEIDLPQGPFNPIEPLVKSNTSDRLLKLQRDISILLQMVRWLYNLYRLKYIELDPYDVAEEFFKRYVSIKEAHVDSAEDYDFIELPRSFPNANEVSDALIQLNETAPTLSDGQTLILYGQKLYDKVEQSLYYYIDQNLEVILPMYLADYYFTEMDYPYQEGNIVFLSSEGIEAWLRRYQVDQSGSYTVVNKIKPNMAELELTYLYQPIENQLFLIRNVPLINGKNIALNIAKLWKETKINAYPEYFEEITSGYKVLMLNIDEGLAILEDKGDDLLILYYPVAKKYAAILPI